jgi:serine/threonine-protein kinase
MAHPEDTVDASGADPLRGRVVGANFRLDELIGAGGMGSVYRAEQLSLGKAVAVKILHQELMTDEVVVKRFEREARSASRLEHPNVVQIIDYGQDRENKVLFIAMELLAGRDLGQTITEDGPMPLPRVVRIMGQVLSALEEAHLQRVIHRDLKPANIMLVERRGEHDLVKVCDFGIAKATGLIGGSSPGFNSMLTARGLVCGTPEYMAPEQARGEEVDGRTDLYAAAVILYQMVTGEVPFTASSPVAVLSQHLDHAPPPPSRKRPDLPHALDQLILDGLAKDPAERPQNAGAFRQALEAACALSEPRTVVQREASARTDTLPAIAAASRATPVVRRQPRRGWIGVATAAALALAALGSFSLVRHGADAPPPPAASLPAGHVDPATSPAPASALPAPAAAPAATASPEAIDRDLVPAPPAERPRTEPARPPVARRRPSAPKSPPGPAPATSEDIAAGSSVTPAPPASPAAPAAAPGEEPSPARAAHDPLGEAEKLLSQGELAQACARAEEARQLAPRSAAVYRFLGKCYMRAGNVARASERYRTYLELAPSASDAAFIQSIVK